MSIGIYQIKNIINNKSYIGHSAELEIRLETHRNRLKANTHVNIHLQRAWNKYGEGAFKFNILEITNNLLIREQYYIDEMGDYNIVKNVFENTNPKGNKRSEKDCDNIRNGIINKRRRYFGKNNPGVCRTWKITNVESGKVYVLEGGIEHFCKEHNLTRSLLTRRAKGLSSTLYKKKWWCEYLDNTYDKRVKK